MAERGDMGRRVLAAGPGVAAAALGVALALLRGGEGRPPAAPAGPRSAAPAAAVAAAAPAAPDRAVAAAATAPRPVSGAGLLVAVDSPAGRPVSGAQVVLARGLGELTRPTGADGTVSFRPLPPGPYRVRVFHPDYAPHVAGGRGTRVEVVAGEVRKLRLTLEAGTVLRGRVVAADSGTPVAGARVTLARREYRRVAAVGTGPDGGFVLAHFPWLPPGERPFALEVVAPGFAPAYAVVAAHRGRPPPLLTVRLRRGAVVTGVVTDAAGRPLEGAVVQGVFRCRFLRDPYRLTARTDRRGRYRIAHVPPGYVVQVWAFREGYRPAYLNLILAPHHRRKVMRPLRLRRRSRSPVRPRWPPVPPAPPPRRGSGR